MKINNSVDTLFAGGGQMGELIRSYDWSQTSIGSPDSWPKSLRIAVRLMLDSPFGMYIAWGNDYIQLYNDGYRPILGISKHPQALGISTRETFAEIWTTIGPMFDGVMEGIPVGFPDFVLHLDRNGFVEECIFDFSYSPIRLEDGKVGGVLVTVIETTKNVKAAKSLKESENRFQNLVREANVGIVVLTGEEMRVVVVNEAYGRLIDLKPNDLLGKPLFDMIPDAKVVFLPILNKVRQTGESIFLYDQPYSVITNEKKIEGYLNVVYQAYKESDGTITGVIALCQDVTETVETREKVEESNQRFRAAMGVVNGIVWTNNANGEMVGEQQGWAGLTGQSYEEYKGYGWTKAVHPDDAQPTIEAWNDAVKESKTFLFEHRVKTKMGEWGLFSIKAIPLLNEDGSIREWVGVHTNITEQKAAEERINESEARFRTLSESVPHMIWTAEPDGKRNFFNQYLLDYTGKTFDELYGDGWQQMISPLDLDRTLKQWNHSIETGEDYKIENRWLRYDGSYHWYLAKGSAQKDEHGKIIEWIGTNTDITEQKSLAEELETKIKERAYQLYIQNETFKQAEESSMQGSYSFNLTTGKLVYSDNLYRLIGYEPNEFEPSLEEFNKHVHPDDKDYVTKAAERVVAKKSSEEWYYRMTTKHGIAINIKGTGRVIESGDQLILVGTLQDVTKEFELNKELQEKEEYSKQIINNAPDAVIVINEHNIITLWNPKTEDIFGWKEEEVLGLNLTDIIIPTQYREAHIEGMKRFLKTGQAYVFNKTLELTALNKNGKEFDISLTVSQANQHGEKLFIAFVRDITVEKQNKEQLIIKTKQLEEVNYSLEFKNIELEKSNAELASFSYVASHDLQEPLRKIQTFGRLILETENFSGKTQDYFNRIIAAGERMQNLIISLLNFSSTSTTNLVFVACDLNTIVEESKEDLHLIIIEKQAVVEYGNLPTINASHVQICQLFTNLIENAIKYSRPGINPHIIITYAIMEGQKIDHPSSNNNKEYHAIKFEDNGIGFEKEYANKIFELFQRLHHKNEYSGTGIGLAIVKKVVTNHNGFILVAGKPNVGSTFTIYIPTV